MSSLCFSSTAISLDYGSCLTPSSLSNYSMTRNSLSSLPLSYLCLLLCLSNPLSPLCCTKLSSTIEPFFAFLAPFYTLLLISMFSLVHILLDVIFVFVFAIFFDPFIDVDSFLKSSEVAAFRICFIFSHYSYSYRESGTLTVFCIYSGGCYLLLPNNLLLSLLAKS